VKEWLGCSAVLQVQHANPCLVVAARCWAARHLACGLAAATAAEGLARESAAAARSLLLAAPVQGEGGQDDDGLEEELLVTPSSRRGKSRPRAPAEGAALFAKAAWSSSTQNVHAD